MDGQKTERVWEMGHGGLLGPCQVVSFCLPNSHNFYYLHHSLETCPLLPSIAISLSICPGIFFLPDQIFHSSNRAALLLPPRTLMGNGPHWLACWVLTCRTYIMCLTSQYHPSISPQNVTWQELVVTEINSNTSKDVLSISPIVWDGWRRPLMLHQGGAGKDWYVLKFP